MVVADQAQTPALRCQAPRRRSVPGAARVGQPPRSPVNGRCRVHGGLSTGPKTEEGRRRIAVSNRARAGRPVERGKREAVTQRGNAL